MADESYQAQRKAKPMPQWRHQKIAHKKQRFEEIRSNREINDHNPNHSSTYDDQDPQGIETRRAKGSKTPRTFSQPSVISVGDKGIFVTTDIGREKKGLLEIGGLVEEYLEQRNLLQGSHVADNASVVSTQHQDTQDNVEDDSDVDIEASIQREISSLTSTSIPTGQAEHQTRKPSQPVKPFQLITLDVPCVSFLRFHPIHPVYSEIDPVSIAHSICNEAMTTGTLRSRYIRRLSPITWLGKTLTNGLANCITAVLPAHFELPTTISSSSSSSSPPSNPNPTPTPTPTPSENQQNNGEKSQGLTFAIRPNIRNNNIMSRSQIITTVADSIMVLGGNKHKVDLTNYQRGIIVEVYRGWIGMSVVNNVTLSSPRSPELSGQNQVRLQEHEFAYGYEDLKRFNLAEIYTHVLNK